MQLPKKKEWFQKPEQEADKLRKAQTVLLALPLIHSMIVKNHITALSLS